MLIDLEPIKDSSRRMMLDSFMQSINSIKSSAAIADISKAIESGDMNLLFRLLGLDESAFSELSEQIRETYKLGGITGVKQIGRIPISSGAARIEIKFDMQADTPDKAVKSMSTRLIRSISEDQRLMIRDHVTRGVREGVNPLVIAKGLLGTRGNNGVREGGVMGITSSQNNWIENARRELLSGNSNYFNRELRDKQLDKKIINSIKKSGTVSDSLLNSAIGSMRKRVLNYRANNIARTESLTLLRAGQYEAIRQSIVKGEVSLDSVKHKWDATGDNRTRLDHLFMEGQVRQFGQPFAFPDGSLALFPGDSSLEAPGGQIINCRCKLNTEIDFISQLVKVKGF